VRGRVITVVSAVIGVPEEILDEDSSQKTVAYWDSIRQIDLVLALEEEFGVLFSDSEVAEIDSIRSILTVLHRKGIPEVNG
jgi:acyl carrier protein